MSLLETNLLYLDSETKVSSQKYMHKICGCFLVSESLPSDLTHLFECCAGTQTLDYNLGKTTVWMWMNQ